MIPGKLITISISCFLIFFESAAQDVTRFFGTSKPVQVTVLRDDLPVSKIPPSIFVKNFVTKSLSVWKQKGEFEKTPDYNNRMSEASLKQKISELESEAQEVLKKEYIKTANWTDLSINPYDADNETFTLSSQTFGLLKIAVPIDQAPSLKQNWSKVIFSDPDFIISDKEIKLTRITITNPVNGQSYQFGQKQNFSDKSVEIKPGIQKTETIIPPTDSKIGELTDERIQKLLDEAVRAEDFEKAVKLQDELDRRKKK